MKVLRHRNFEVAASQLTRALDQRQPGGAIFLVGPSGVGKTTLRHLVLKSVYGSPLQWPPGTTPVVETIATLPTNSFFNSRALATELILQLDSPSLPWIDATESGGQLCAFLSSVDGVRDARVIDRGGLARRPEAEQWRLLERYIRSRSCLVASIDQATALLKNRKSKDPTDHMLHLMAFAEKTGITLLLTGVPEVTQLWDIHQELRRRVDVIWMPPYSERYPGDRTEFSKLLSSFHRRYPNVPNEVLLGMDVELLAACGGVYAELERLLVRSLNHAHDLGRSEVCRNDIEQSVHSQTDLETLWSGLHAFHKCMSAGSLKSRALEIRRAWT